MARVKIGVKPKRVELIIVLPANVKRRLSKLPHLAAVWRSGAQTGGLNPGLTTCKREGRAV